MQKRFSDLEYAAKKKLTRRDMFLAKIDSVTPWSQLHALIEPFYPKVEMGDAGYQDVEKREENLGKDVTWHVAMKRAKRKALPNNKLGRMAKKLEHLKASVRANLVLAGRQFKVSETRAPS